MATPARLLTRIEQRELFDERPIKLEGFTLRTKGADASSTATLEQFVAALEFTFACEEASPFWVGDLWNYASGRPDWRGKLDQALTECGRPLTLKSLHQYGYISRKVTGEARRKVRTISHANAVVSLEPDEQAQWIEKANTEGWSAGELRKEIRHAHRRTVLTGQAPTLHTVDVAVRLTVEAVTSFAAEEEAMTRVKDALADGGLRAHVIGARAPGRADQ